MRKLVTCKNVCKPAKNKSVFLVKIIIFHQLTMTHGTAEMFWMPRSTNRSHTFLQTSCAKITNIAYSSYISVSQAGFVHQVSRLISKIQN